MISFSSENILRGLFFLTCLQKVSSLAAARVAISINKTKQSILSFQATTTAPTIAATKKERNWKEIFGNLFFFFLLLGDDVNLCEPELETTKQKDENRIENNWLEKGQQKISLYRLPNLSRLHFGLGPCAWVRAVVSICINCHISFGTNRNVLTFLLKLLNLHRASLPHHFRQTGCCNATPSRNTEKRTNEYGCKNWITHGLNRNNNNNSILWRWINNEQEKKKIQTKPK